MKKHMVRCTIAMCLMLSWVAVAEGQDSDRDGLSDAVEQSLLVQFMPSFMIGSHDCAIAPAAFKAGLLIPSLEAEDGTIYGQVFPVKGSTVEHPVVEIHFYHLWWKDCGPRGHDLDTEHVAVLVKALDKDLDKAKWKAMYWYAGAHEDTVCDVSQIARAETLHAEDRGAKVWVSPGKHASYLSERLCTGGCGADRCEQMMALGNSQVINLGEPDQPMNGSAFIASNRWPLAAKMSASNFPQEAVDRVNELDKTDLAWFHAGRHPVQPVIAASGTTAGAIALSSENTSFAISVAGDSTANALATAEDSTGNALEKSYRKTKSALGSAARHVGEALGVTDKTETSK